MMSHKCLKIIFNLKERGSYLNRYLKLLNNYKLCFDILVINENSEINFEFKKFSQTKIINYKFHSNISGMNSIFRAMYHAKDIINSYDYVCFVEDDNFIFPSGITKCILFLDNNINYVGCNGESFLFEKKNNYKFLAPYNSPHFFSQNLISRAKKYNKNYGGLTYYSIIRKKIFLNICYKITLIKDDNLSEIFFNYLLLINGNLKKIDNLYLAREYPRPKVYNIPKLEDWINNSNLLNDINVIIYEIKKYLLILKNENHSKLFLELTIFKYLSLRFENNLIKFNLFKKFFKKINQIFFKRKEKVKYFLKQLNSI